MKPTFAAAMLTVALVLAAPAHAAGRGDDSAFQFRVGWFAPSGNSDFWDANEAAFTLDSSDFNDATVGVGYAGSINNHLEYGVGLDFYQHTQQSADRAYTDQYGYAILHDTTLTLTPLTADLRVLPGGRYKQTGPEIGRASCRERVYVLV